MNRSRVLVLLLAFLLVAVLPVAAVAANNKERGENIQPVGAAAVNPDLWGFGAIVFGCFDGGYSDVVCNFSINSDTESGPITYLNAQVKYSDSYVEHFKYQVPYQKSVNNQSTNYVSSPGSYWGELSGTVTTVYAFNTIVPVKSTTYVK